MGGSILKRIALLLIFTTWLVSVPALSAEGDSDIPNTGFVRGTLPEQDDPSDPSQRLKGEVDVRWVTLPSGADLSQIVQSVKPLANEKKKKDDKAPPTGAIQLPLVIVVANQPAFLQQAQALQTTLQNQGVTATIMPVNPALARQAVAQLPTQQARGFFGTAYDRLLKPAVQRLGDAYQTPTPKEVSLGLFTGGYRLLTSAPIYAGYVSLGLDPMAAASIVATLTARTTIRDVYIQTVDNLYQGRKAGEPPPIENPEEKKSGFENFVKVAKETGKRQIENLFFLEMVRLQAELGNAPSWKVPEFSTLAGQVDIGLSVLGPGLTGALLGATRSQVFKDNPTARTWWNFNTFLASAVFQNLIWAGLGGPDIFKYGAFHVSTALAANMVHDLALSFLMRTFPKTFEKIAEFQDAVFQGATKVVGAIYRGTANLLSKTFSPFLPRHSEEACPFQNLLPTKRLY